MVLKLAVYIRNVISFSYKPKPQWNSDILVTFVVKFSILAYMYISLKNFEPGHTYDVTVMSYLGCWYLFWYAWKEETPSYTMVLITCTLGASFLSSQGVVTTPLGRHVTKKRLGKTRVKGLNNEKVNSAMFLPLKCVHVGLKDLNCLFPIILIKITIFISL